MKPPVVLRSRQLIALNFFLRKSRTEYTGPCSFGLKRPTTSFRPELPPVLRTLPLNLFLYEKHLCIEIILEAQMATPKKVLGIHEAGSTHWVGDGFHVRNLFPSNGIGDAI